MCLQPAGGPEPATRPSAPSTGGRLTGGGVGRGDARLEVALLPVRDGLSLIRRVA